MKKAREFFLPTYRMRVIDYYIHKGMQSKNLISSRQLAERCGVSQKTIIRLIERMKNYHLIPIEYDPQLHGWYYTEKNYCLPTIEVNDNDLFSVCIAQKALQQYKGSPVYIDLVRIFDKIIDALPTHSARGLTDYSSRFSMVPFPTTEGDDKIWTEIFGALQEARAVTIWYQKPDQNSVESRKIFPLHASHYRGSWYTLGYCHSRGEARVFNLSRIKKIAAAKETLTEEKSREIYLKSFDQQKALAESFDMHIGKESKTVVISFTPAIAPYIEERKWHSTQELTKSIDGSLLFKAQINNFTGIIPWILSWGANAKILDPPELLAEIKSEIEQLFQLYK